MRGVRNSEIDPSTIWHRYDDKEGKRHPEVAPDLPVTPIISGGTGATTAAAARTNLGVGTGDSPEFAAVNVGHASDTTITRTGAGDIAVEGNGVYRAGGTDVAVADGGTGASTAATARTNLGLGDVWVSWSPTWTNLTVGDGTVVALYVQIGKTVIARLSIVFGSTTSVSGDIQFSLPVTRAAYAGAAGLTPLGMARAQDTSVPTIYPGDIINTSTTVSSIRFHDTSGTYETQAITSSTIPFTWANTDEIALEMVYEAA